MDPPLMSDPPDAVGKILHNPRETTYMYIYYLQETTYTQSAGNNLYTVCGKQALHHLGQTTYTQSAGNNLYTVCGKQALHSLQETTYTQSAGNILYMVCGKRALKSLQETTYTQSAGANLHTICGKQPSQSLRETAYTQSDTAVRLFVYHLFIRFILRQIHIEFKTWSQVYVFRQLSLKNHKCCIICNC